MEILALVAYYVKVIIAQIYQIVLKVKNKKCLIYLLFLLLNSAQ